MTILSHNRILLTGAAGGLGQALRERLKGNCAVLRLADRVAMAPAGAQEEVMVNDLADAQGVLDMMAGVDAVVHLGGSRSRRRLNPSCRLFDSIYRPFGRFGHQHGARYPLIRGNATNGVGLT